jgi:hypothetical protein
VETETHHSSFNLFVRVVTQHFIYWIILIVMHITLAVSSNYC